jgi:hypothetical protein
MIIRALLVKLTSWQNMQTGAQESSADRTQPILTQSEAVISSITSLPPSESFPFSMASSLGVNAEIMQNVLPTSETETAVNMSDHEMMGL